MLLCLFVIFMVTVWLTDLLATQTVHMAAVRNTVEYEQALYLANAGVHHAAAVLEATPSWRGTVTDGGYPASGSYQAVVVDGSTSGTADITAEGISGSVTRRILATAQVN